MTDAPDSTEAGRAIYAQRVEEAFQRWIDEGNAPDYNPRLMRPLRAKAGQGWELPESEIIRAANCDLEQASTLSRWLETLRAMRDDDGDAAVSASHFPRRTDAPVHDDEASASNETTETGALAASFEGSIAEPAASGRALGLSRDSFAATSAQAAQAAQSASPRPVGATVTGDGVRLTWPAYTAREGQTIVYRVVSRPGPFAFKPEEASHLGAVAETEFVDSRRQDSGAILGYQVWVYAGRNEQDAARTQPVLWAQQKIVQPPQNVTVAAGEGTLTVFGKWEPLDDPNAIVRVHRVPIQEAEYEDWDQPRYRISANGRNVGGFVDDDGQSGQTFRYYLLVQTVSDNVGLLSPVVERDATFVDRIRQITDLHAERLETEQGESLEISWTPPPVGQVEIYWAQHQPEMGIENQAHDAAVLSQLKVGEPIGYPVSDSRDGRAIIRAVPWPRGWTSVHLTAITRLGDEIFPSASATVLTGLVEIPAARLYQRVSHQNITLVWPERRGAAAQEFLFDWVKVYSCAPDTAPEEINEHTATLLRISHDAYKKQGGVRLAIGAEPKRVVLVPGSTQSGQDKPGKPYVLEYPGLRTVSYTVAKPFQPFGKMRPIAVRFRATDRFEGPPSFVLVHHPQRLPLSVHDGDVYEMEVKDEPALSRNGRAVTAELGPAWTESVWKARVPREGFIRIFAEGDPQRLTRLAVLDPSISLLDVGGW
ncbi:MAG TPA: hypothetical protein PKE40_03705 [Arachnia sp.]|nr:hypothetical protein [Arachnia sp.]HMT85436.1 hypothetical protein [Arachnia sp.]